MLRRVRPGPGAGAGGAGAAGVEPPQAAARAQAAPAARARAARRAAPGQPHSADAGEPVDEREFERLRAWRLGQAQGKPAFTVAADAVLSEVLRRRPRSADELIEIRGIGPAFLEKHGGSLLAELEELEAAGEVDLGGPRGPHPDAGETALATAQQAGESLY